MGERNQNSDIDLESLNPNGSIHSPQGLRRKIHLRNLPASGSLQRVNSFLSTASARRSAIGERVRTSLTYIRNFPVTVPENPPAEAEDVDELSDEKVREEFMILIRGEGPVTTSMKEACDWYSQFLESKFQRTWISLLRPCLDGLNASNVKPGPGELAIVYRFMKAVGEKMMQKTDLALTDVVDSLENLRYLKDDEPGEEYDENVELSLPEERARPNQLAFAALGWLSQMYDPRVPKLDEDTRKLRIAKTPSTNTQDVPPLVSRTFTTFEQGFDSEDQPFYTLLRKFGDLIPEFKGDTRSTSDWGHQALQPNEQIENACVRFHTLIKLAKVKIEWVDILSLHFEFDSRNQTLRLFRFPSFCRIMYSDQDETLLSTLFNDHSKALNPQLIRERDHTNEFFREVLLSYRLIFGQHKKSYKAFSNQVLPFLNNDFNYSNSSPDPMLPLLCGKNWNADGPKQIYEEIGAEAPSEYYSANLDFPFLGKRILVLQAYVKNHNAHSLRALWHDHRNVSWWWTFWAVVFLGVITVILAILGLVFQVWQVVLAQKALNSS